MTSKCTTVLFLFTVLFIALCVDAAAWNARRRYKQHGEAPRATAFLTAGGPAKGTTEAEKRVVQGAKKKLKEDLADIRRIMESLLGKF